MPTYTTHDSGPTAIGWTVHLSTALHRTQTWAPDGEGMQSGPLDQVGIATIQDY